MRLAEYACPLCAAIFVSEHVEDDVIPVPHAADLVHEGLAEQITVRTGPKTTTTIWKITPEGYERIRLAMQANAEEALAAGKGNWVRPRSSGKPLSH
jgi:hypothetical protein